MKEITIAPINFSIKNIKNYGRLNSSFSKPISVLQTNNTDAIFKALFNINIVNGFDIGKKVYGELVEEVGDDYALYDMQSLFVNRDSYTPYLFMRNPSLGYYHAEGVSGECKTVVDALKWRNYMEVWEAPLQLT